MGKQTKPKDDSPRSWKVNFAPGTIKAVGLNGGKVVATYELRTAGAPAKIILTIDKNTIADKWDDVVFVNVVVFDENGTLVPDADSLINFTAEGAGFVAGVIAQTAIATSHIRQLGAKLLRECVWRC